MNFASHKKTAHRRSAYLSTCNYQLAVVFVIFLINVSDENERFIKYMT